MSPLQIQHHTLAALVGYDVGVLTELPAPAQRHLERVAEAWMLSCALLASPLAYATWLIEHSLWLSLAVGLGSFFVVLNMLRLAAAGGGAAAHFPEQRIRRYRPALGTSLVLGMLALLCAQPAQLPLWSTELEAPVRAQRALLIEQHERALDELGLAKDAHYQRQIERCEFLVLRLQHMWRSPTRALQLTALYVLLVLLPLLWARYVALSALRAYELLRWRQNRASIVREARAVDRSVRASLAQWPTYSARESAFADAPFDTSVRSALLLAPRRPRAAPEPPPKRRWFKPWRRS